ncbi:MAG TPA: nuclear transport factor 2 family protein, partial [Thermoanaerobaculia bacterium]|nr:nuclear transport factor 2 family protein [Thermoanaerobaculia bacterium]
MRRLFVFAYCLFATATLADDAAAIRAKIVKGAEAAMRGDAAGIMSHYAKDIVLSYPGIADQDYDTLLKGYSEPRPAGMTMRTEPEFDELLLSGDLAVVRVNWTTTLSFIDPPRQTTRQARDIQVWQKRNGEWLFVRGMHFRNAVAVATSGANVTTVIPKTGRTAKQDAAAIREAIRRSRVTADDAVIIRRGVADETIEQYPITEILVSGGLAVVRLGAP